MKLTEQDYKELMKDFTDVLALAFDHGAKFCRYIKDSDDPMPVVEAEVARRKMFDRICRKLSATVYRDEPIPYKSEEVLA